MLEKVSALQHKPDLNNPTQSIKLENQLEFNKT